MIRILHTESSLGWGGQEIRILSESAVLNQTNDFDCCVVCDHMALLKHRNRWPGVPIYSINLSKKRIACLWELKNQIEQIRPHVIISHSSTDSWLAAIARRLWFPAIKLIRVRHVSAKISAGLTTNWLYRNADHLITTSEHIRNHIITELRVLPSRITSIPTGVDVELAWHHITPIERSHARSTLNIPSDEFVYGMVSTLRSWKGHADALAALREVPKGRLIIVGDGPQEPSIEAMVKENSLSSRVQLLGHRSDVREIAAAFDGFLQPSYANEGVSQSVLQAMAMGIPVIASDIGGLNEVIADRYTGILVPPQSPKDLANAMLELMRDSDLSRSLSLNAHEYVNRSQSLKIRSSQMSDLIKKIVDA